MSFVHPQKDERREAKLKAFDRLLTIMDELRLNCPWDQKQTIDSLRLLTIEETYELSEAILEADYDEVKKEIGDIMLHLLFYSRIADEHQLFDIADVLHGIADKMVRRHPHVYGATAVNGEEDVKKNWEKIKQQEKGKSSGPKRVLEGVPSALPAMVKAYRIQEKAKGAGFQWETSEGAWLKVNEEISELEKATTPEDKEGEFGDVLFSLINYARYLGIDPDKALTRTNKKFISRFNHIEESAIAAGRNLDDMTLEEMDHYWNEARYGKT